MVSIRMMEGFSGGGRGEGDAGAGRGRGEEFILCMSLLCVFVYVCWTKIIQGEEEKKRVFFFFFFFSPRS